MFKYSLKLISLVFLLSFLINCKKETKTVTTEKTASIDSIASRYYEDYLKLHPLDATAQGDYRYNDQLPINISR